MQGWRAKCNTGLGMETYHFCWGCCLKISKGMVSPRVNIWAEKSPWTVSLKTLFIKEGEESQEGLTNVHIHVRKGSRRDSCPWSRVQRRKTCPHYSQISGTLETGPKDGACGVITTWWQQGAAESRRVARWLSVNFEGPRMLKTEAGLEHFPVMLTGAPAGLAKGWRPAGDAPARPPALEGFPLKDLQTPTLAWLQRRGPGSKRLRAVWSALPGACGSHSAAWSQLWFHQRVKSAVAGDLSYGPSWLETVPRSHPWPQFLPNGHWTLSGNLISVLLISGQWKNSWSSGNPGLPLRLLRQFGRGWCPSSIWASVLVTLIPGVWWASRCGDRGQVQDREPRSEGAG